MSKLALAAETPSYAQTNGDILYNVKRVILEELIIATGLVNPSGKKYVLECDSEIALEPMILEGESKVLRDSTKLLARAKEEDLIEGYKLTLTSVRFPVGAIPLIQGGTLTMGQSDNVSKIAGYTAPKMAEGNVGKKPFKLTAYVENYDGDDIVNYVKFEFNKCKGKPFNLDLKKDFFAPVFEVTATENTKANKASFGFTYVTALPAIE